MIVPPFTLNYFLLQSRRQRRQLQQQLVRNGGYAPYRPPDNVPDDEDVGQQLLPVSYIEQEGQQPIPVYDASYTTYREHQLQMQQSQNAPVTRYAERSRPISGNYIVGPADGRTPDLSRDTLVNDLLERQNARAGLIMVDPDAELTEVRDGKVVHAYAPNARANKRHVRAHARVIRSTKGSIQRF